MTQPPVGSYDDAPEAEVATVLEVPLLWTSGIAARSARSDSPVAANGAARGSSTPGSANRRGAHRRPRGGAPAPRTTQGAHRGATGRHRAEASAQAAAPAPLLTEPAAPTVSTRPTVSPSTAPVDAPRRALARSPGRPEQEGLAHTLRVGAVSATIVLVVFVAGLLALATWLP